MHQQEIIKLLSLGEVKIRKLEMGVAIWEGIWLTGELLRGWASPLHPIGIEPRIGRGWRWPQMR
jgi:hypothetical protein